MSEVDTGIQLVQRPVELFLAHQLRATELVRIVDDLVAQACLDGLNPHQQELVERLHDALALYVPNDPTRQTEPGYIGEVELRQKAAEFVAGLRSINSDG